LMMLFMGGHGGSGRGGKVSTGQAHNHISAGHTGDPQVNDSGNQPQEPTVKRRCTVRRRVAPLRRRGSGVHPPPPPRGRQRFVSCGNAAVSQFTRPVRRPRLDDGLLAAAASSRAPASTRLRIRSR
jgi:hypothetical protein